MKTKLSIAAMGMLSLVFLCQPLRAQDKPAEAAVKQEKAVDTTPKWNLYIRSWYQAEFTKGATLPSQFFIKEARFGVSGNINEYASYKFLADAAKITTLSTVNGSVPNSTADKTLLKSASVSGNDFLQDAEVDIMPMKSLTLSMGQFKVPFSTDNNRSGSVADFANRPFITNVSPSIRDLGFMVSYKITGGVPVELFGGVFNGAGADKKENDKTSDYAVRGVVHPTKDLGLSVNYYGGQATGAKLAMANVGVDYKLGSFFIDGEYGMKSSKLPAATTNSFSYFGYAMYTFSFPEAMVTNIIPAVRFDAYDPNKDKVNDDVNRITAGLTVTFAKISFAHFRLNYEKYNYQDPAIIDPSYLVLEFQTRF